MSFPLGVTMSVPATRAVGLNEAGLSEESVYEAALALVATWEREDAMGEDGAAVEEEKKEGVEGVVEEEKKEGGESERRGRVRGALLEAVCGMLEKRGQSVRGMGAVAALALTAGEWVFGKGGEELARRVCTCARRACGAACWRGRWAAGAEGESAREELACAGLEVLQRVLPTSEVECALQCVGETLDGFPGSWRVQQKGLGVLARAVCECEWACAALTSGPGAAEGGVLASRVARAMKAHAGCVEVQLAAVGLMSNVLKGGLEDGAEGRMGGQPGQREGARLVARCAFGEEIPRLVASAMQDARHGDNVELWEWGCRVLGFLGCVAEARMVPFVPVCAEVVVCGMSLHAESRAVAAAGLTALERLAGRNGEQWEDLLEAGAAGVLVRALEMKPVSVEVCVSGFRLAWVLGKNGTCARVLVGAGLLLRVFACAEAHCAGSVQVRKAFRQLVSRFAVAVTGSDRGGKRQRQAATAEDVSLAVRTARTSPFAGCGPAFGCLCLADYARSGAKGRALVKDMGGLEAVREAIMRRGALPEVQRAACEALCALCCPVIPRK